MKSGPIRWRVYLPHLEGESQVIFFFRRGWDEGPRQFSDGRWLQKQSTCQFPITCLDPSA